MRHPNGSHEPINPSTSPPPLLLMTVFYSKSSSSSALPLLLAALVRGEDISATNAVVAATKSRVAIPNFNCTCPPPIQKKDVSSTMALARTMRILDCCNTPKGDTELKGYPVKRSLSSEEATRKSAVTVTVAVVLPRCCDECCACIMAVWSFFTFNVASYCKITMMNLGFVIASSMSLSEVAICFLFSNNNALHKSLDEDAFNSLAR
mmetsp:Transcript_7090/g.11769  ORF Transcript_7090/g.11769 Transcript_7090/m.11769 type:complete len:207 (+) Transcript_7090:66-686(+)